MTFRETIEQLTQLTGQKPTNKECSFFVEYFPTFRYALGFGELGTRVLIITKEKNREYYFKVMVQVPSFPLLSASDTVQLTSILAQASSIAVQAQEIVGGKTWSVNEVNHYKEECHENQQPSMG